MTVGKSGDHYVFMIPVAMELDLKKAAAAVGEKSVHMVKSKELLGLTGYVHGGCSPLYDRIYFSGGRIGCQIETSLDSLKAAIPVKEADITA